MDEPEIVPAALVEALERRLLEPYRQIAEEVRDDMERSFVGEDADLKGLISESYLVFGTACAHLAAQRLAELEAQFNRTWDLDMRAIKLWREANPGNDLVLPDYTALLHWMMDQLAERAKGMG